jgi:hypothetical protein
MKKYLLFITIVAAVVACNKTTTLPAYTPPFSKNFSVSSLSHTADTVNVGDTIYLHVAGTIADTTKDIYPYITVVDTLAGATFTWGTSPSNLPTAGVKQSSGYTPPAAIKLTKVIGAATNGLYAWTSTLTLTGVTSVPHNTKLTITGLFTYQLSLSSEGSSASATDKKTIYVQ